MRMEVEEERRERWGEEEREREMRKGEGDAKRGGERVGRVDE